MERINLTADRSVWLKLLFTPGFSVRVLLAIQKEINLHSLLSGEVPLSELPPGLQKIMVAYEKICPKKVEKELFKINELRCEVLTYNDDNYPNTLREINSPPLLLYIEGDLSLLKQRKVALVGSRSACLKGEEVAYFFAKSLAVKDFVVVSGLARGIDSSSHYGALASTGATVAVIGTGLDITYPAINKGLAKKIKNKGLVISEFPCGTMPKAGNFPKRNRIISGLSEGVLVVQATRRSGSLVTAKMALEQNKEIFAIPWDISNPLSRGCHALIRDGAKLVESVDDILEELPSRVFPVSDECSVEAQVGKVLGKEPLPLDVLVARSGIAARELSTALMQMELQGMVAVRPGGYVKSTGGGL